MTTLLLPEMAMGLVEPLARAAEEETPPSAGHLRMLAEVSQIIAEGIRKLWGHLQARLGQGMEGQELRQTARLFVECLETKLRILARIKEQATNLGAAGNEACVLASQVEVDVTALLTDARGLLEFVSRPVPSGFLERAEKAMAEDTGDWVSGDDILARIQAGGDL